MKTEGKSKAIPLTGLGGPWSCEMSRLLLKYWETFNILYGVQMKTEGKSKAIPLTGRGGP
jgi:hypothetical protein